VDGDTYVAFGTKGGLHDVSSGNMACRLKAFVSAPHITPPGQIYESPSKPLVLDILYLHKLPFPLHLQSSLTSHIMSLGRTVKLNTGASIP
jgi:hypothetical protein